jgi:hypothetical protein
LIDTLSLLCVDCLFFNCRCVQTPRHLLFVDRAFSTSIVLSAANANLFVVPANPPFLHLLCIDCAFSTSAAHSFSFINWDIAISVKFLVSSAFLRYSAFLRFLRRFLIVQAKQRLLLR